MLIKRTIVMVTWASALLIALLFLSLAKVKPFDPLQKLQDAAMVESFDNNFETLFSPHIDVRRHKVTVFYGNNCICEKMSKRHVKSIEKLAIAEGFTFELRDITDSPIKDIIPSTPAAVVFDVDGRLTYLGPISSGAFCTTSIGLVESFIKSGFKRLMPGAAILTEHSGCFCNQDNS